MNDRPRASKSGTVVAAAITGLSDDEVLLSRRANGSNALTPITGASLLQQYLEKFRDPTIIIAPQPHRRAAHGSRGAAGRLPSG